MAASLTEPLAVSLTAVLNADIPLGGSVIVLGPGPIGLMAARLAKLRGAGFVAITGLSATCPREEARFRLAKDFGCNLIIETDKDYKDAVLLHARLVLGGIQNQQLGVPYILSYCMYLSREEIDCSQ